MSEARDRSNRHWGLRVGLSLFYAAAGILHLAWPSPFLTIMPGFVPKPDMVIAITGICELLGAIGLWFRATVRSAAVGLALYAVCVYPANIKHAVDGLTAIDAGIWPWFYHVPRLALQPVLVWLPLYAAGILRWPFRDRNQTV
ncbi:putative membrane protein [Rhizobium sp. PP-F2F-G48]|uniref:DoxX family protein n=1 Tax=Rhizobium sp. PP-F2F-G48 TaxID=2135651 RepID=UPI001044FD39|nr:DoxX family protein [Rhizobium sp. PP-F2F-G48]TCM53286.1 putative membrane protein [Rhizobium sp. PP-F2F-G48]